MQRRKFMAAASGVAGLLGLSAVGWPGSPVPGAIERGDAMVPGRRLYRGAGLAFGTTITIQAVHGDEGVARAAIEAALAQARAVDRLMTVHRDDSQVQRLNRSGRLDAPDPRLLAVLREALRLSALTQGAFDITVQPLWQAAHGRTDRASARSLVGWRDVQVRERAVRLRRPGMSITLNGIAQGYATDLAMAALHAHGIADALVDIGEFGGSGERLPGQPWRVGIADPRAAERMLHAVRLQERSLATSGDYATAFGSDFSRHHIVDPATGESPAELACVSVAAPTAMLADGLATALMVMGSERGLALVEGWRGVDALFVGKDGRENWSAGFPLA